MLVSLMITSSVVCVHPIPFHSAVYLYMFPQILLRIHNPCVWILYKWSQDGMSLASISGTRVSLCRHFCLVVCIDSYRTNTYFVWLVALKHVLLEKSI
jgi:hypothetical protein